MVVECLLVCCYAARLFATMDVFVVFFVQQTEVSFMSVACMQGKLRTNI